MFLFMLKILLLLTVASVTGKSVQSEELPELKWPKKYTFEATKVSLTSALVEDIQYWRISKKSRVDYNSGAVKSIKIKGKRKASSAAFGVQYDIHPETTEEYLNKLICTRKNGTLTDQIKPENLLPRATDFEHVGKDFLDIGEVQKYVIEDEEANTKKYLWASLKNSTWVPVRIEDLEFNSWLETLKKHTIYDIYNFETEFDENVFDVDQYDCTGGAGIKDSEENDIDLSILDPENDDHVEAAFNRFKQEHNRNYDTEEEHEMRKNIFHKNLRKVQAHNSMNSDYKMTLNKFSDRTREEKQRSTGLIRRKAGEVGTHAFPYDEQKISQLVETLPADVDLRLQGYVSPVRDQEDCGSCWSFGTTSAAEGALARSNGGRLLRLANQALVDCAWGFGAGGCNGGSDTAAYHWMIKYGLPTEEEYGPYKNKDGYCEIDNMTTIYPIKGFTDVTPFSVEALKIAVMNHGPLSVSIDVGSSESLYNYNGGIFYDKDCTTTKVDHEVTLVGYGEIDGDSYWIIKNSWGRDWGIDGYFHISTRDNACGIATEPTYVVM
ncbi:procathepsin L-like [Maniola jurtina]|uniref:procathepsin L-like n=1 Tax=Maniola jurtina TaxID=191418 RepID=UPI001E68C8EE|nr:procathepsin L-like [Maniola jurtina]